MTVKEQCLEIIQDMIDTCNDINDEKYLFASCVLQAAKLRIERDVKDDVRYE